MMNDHYERGTIRRKRASGIDLFLLAAAFAILLLTAIPGALAYLTAKGTETGSVTSGNNSIKIVTTGSFPSAPAPGTAASSGCTAAVQNDGNIPCYVRMKVICSSGELGKAVREATAFSSSWRYDASDGYYYLSQPLAAGAQSPNLFDTFRISANTTEVGLLNYGIHLYAESVQKGNAADAAAAWSGM